MNKLQRISIITPSFNQGRFIERTIESVLGQDYPDVEYIVMDGGSTDETVDILKRYGSRIIWRSEKDRGQSDAINKGLRLSTGGIVAYLNSDDVYEKGALRKVAGYFDAHPDKLWLTGRCRIIDEFDREVRGFVASYKNFLLRRYSYNILLVTNFISQPATFFRRRLMEEMGLFDENEHRVMDYDYWLRAGAKYPPGVMDEGLAAFRVYRASKTSSAFRETFRQEMRVGRKYSRSHLLNALHYLNYAGICATYTLMDALGGKKERST